MVKQVETIESQEPSKLRQSVHVTSWQEYPESVVRILLAQPLNPLVKLEFKVMSK